MTTACTLQGVHDLISSPIALGTIAGVLLWCIVLHRILRRALARPVVLPRTAKPYADLRERRLEYDFTYGEFAVLSGVSARTLFAIEHGLHAAEPHDVERVRYILR